VAGLDSTQFTVFNETLDAVFHLSNTGFTVNGDNQNPIQNAVTIVIGGFIRTALVWISGLLAAHQLVTKSEQSTLTDPILIAALTTTALTFAWSAYTRLREKFKLNAAMRTSKHSQETLQALVKRSSVAQILSTQPPHG